MIIYLKNKHTVQFDDFTFKCCIGKKGLTKYKKEGDFKTPKGIFKFENLYYRKDKVKKPVTTLKCIEIKKTMGWCNDSTNQKYNKLIKVEKNISHEKLFRNDSKYDLLIPIKYNFDKATIPNKGSCIFLHLTKNYKPTAGCIALNKKDFLIILKLINKNTKIKTI